MEHKPLHPQLIHKYSWEKNLVFLSHPLTQTHKHIKQTFGLTNKYTLLDPIKWLNAICSSLVTGSDFNILIFLNYLQTLVGARNKTYEQQPYEWKYH